MSTTRTKNQPAAPTSPAPGTRIPLGSIEIETGPTDRRRTIPPDVLAGLLSIAEDLWYNDSQGWTAFDHEQIALVATTSRTCSGTSWARAGVSTRPASQLVEKLTEEIEARTTAALGVNPAYYTVVVRDQVSA
jgi:hypothetical protein